MVLIMQREILSYCYFYSNIRFSFMVFRISDRFCSRDRKNLVQSYSWQNDLASFYSIIRFIQYINISEKAFFSFGMCCTI